MIENSEVGGGSEGRGKGRGRINENAGEWAEEGEYMHVFFTLIELGKFGNDMEVNYVTLSFIWNKHMRIANAHEEF